jgi:hypothetical protein
MEGMRVIFTSSSLEPFCAGHKREAQRRIPLDMEEYCPGLVQRQEVPAAFYEAFEEDQLL